MLIKLPITPVRTRARPKTSTFLHLQMVMKPSQFHNSECSSRDISSQLFFVYFRTMQLHPPFHSRSSDSITDHISRCLMHLLYSNQSAVSPNRSLLAMHQNESNGAKQMVSHAFHYLPMHRPSAVPYQLSIPQRTKISFLRCSLGAYLQLVAEPLLYWCRRAP